MDKLQNELYQKGLINQDQYAQLEKIKNNQVISVYYELRIILYLGVMLFTGGAGYIAYENIGEFGHISFMLFLLLGIGVGGYYIQKKSYPFSNDIVMVDHIYFDYAVLLVALLIVTFLTYAQVYFEIESLVTTSSFLTAVLFVSMAYRYDHRGVLSMGITALAAAFGLTASPVNWAMGNVENVFDWYLVAVILGLLLLGIGRYTDKRGVKKHFKFTYYHFGFLLFYMGGMTLMFDSSFEEVTALLLILITGGMLFITWKHKEFLFFVYSGITGYIAMSYLFLLTDLDFLMFGLYYFPFSIIGMIVFLVKNRKHFSND